MMKCERCGEDAWYIGKDIQVCREHHTAYLFEMQENEHQILQTKLDTAISALKKLRHMDTWQNVKQINDFLDETIKEVE